MKFCKIIAGPNGSGKSAYFKYACDNALITRNDMPYLCGDDVAEQLRELKINLDEDSLNREAQQIIFKKRVEFMMKGNSFIYETVCSHPSHLEFFNDLKRKGYFISLVYIATDNSDINVSRVMRRVQEGGHNVPVEKIKNRYERCLQIYPRLFCLADEALVFDNSIKLELCLKKEKNGTIKVHNILHQWAIKDILLPNK